jgi:putative acetyltransferase
MNTIIIRPFNSSDLPTVIQLFKEAVAAINIRHYSPEQVAVWTDIDSERWLKKLEQNIAFVAEMDSTIVGFADISHEGYLDRMYVHKDYQARWVSLHLFKAIEKAARELGLTKITTDCSITAKVPAERMGFKVVKEQIVEKNGVQFTNYHMEKKLV